jgi:hypothetical protein
MVVLRQRIETSVTIEGCTYRLIVMREFVEGWLFRRRISESDFFDFVQQNGSLLTILARRKLQRLKAKVDQVTLDKSDLPY